MTALRAVQKDGTVSGNLPVRVRVAPNSGIYRHGRWWKGGDVLTVGEWDAAKIVRRGVAEYVS